MLSLTLALDQLSVQPGRPARANLVIAVSSGDTGEPLARTSMTVMFVIDVSGSMKGPPLDHVIQSVDRIVQFLGPRDQVGVVAFSNHAEEILPLRAVTDDARKTILNAVHALQAGNKTNMEAGLRMAFEAMPPRKDDERQLVLLLSDGAPNIGYCTPLTLAELARGVRSRSSVWTLGYGPHHQEDILMAISNAAGGRYEYIPQPQVSEFVFAKVLGAQGMVVADTVELTLKPAPGFDVTRLYGKPEVRYGAGGLHLPLPDFFVGSRKPFVAEVSIMPPRTPGRWGAFEAELRFRSVDTRKVYVAEARLEVDVSDEEIYSNDDAWIDVLLARTDESRMEARNLADRGQFEGAAAVLATMIKEIEQAPGFVPFDGSPLAEACEELRDESMAMKMKPNPEDYKAFRRSRISVSVSETGYGSTSVSEADNVYGREILKVIAGDYPQAQLEQMSGIEAGRLIRLRPEQIIGRAQTADVVVLNPNITRHHSRIMAQRGRFFLMDLGSANGTWLNGARVETHILSNGDVIGVSDVKFRYQEIVKGAEPRLMAVSGDGNIYVVERDRLFVMGRSRACTLVIESETVGRQHAAVRFRDGEYWFEDYGSEHGTKRTNGKKVTERMIIQDGDELLLGGHPVKFVFRT